MTDTSDLYFGNRHYRRRQSEPWAYQVDGHGPWWTLGPNAPQSLMLNSLAQVTWNVCGEDWTAETMARIATEIERDHNPANQDHNYDRCELCDYTRDPCDARWIAAALIAAIEPRQIGLP